MLVLPKPLWERVVAHCLDCLPFEACGLLGGREYALSEPVEGFGLAGVPQGVAEVARGAAGPRGRGAGVAREATREATREASGVLESFAGQGVAEVREVYPASNAARSARVYTVEPKDLLRADREADRAGFSLIGVWHSHTHTPAYPSPTDIAQAPDPLWHYVLVSLSDTDPVLRSYRIVGEDVSEEQVLAIGL